MFEGELLLYAAVKPLSFECVSATKSQVTVVPESISAVAG